MTEPNTYHRPNGATVPDERKGERRIYFDAAITLGISARACRRVDETERRPMSDRRELGNNFKTVTP